MVYLPIYSGNLVLKFSWKLTVVIVQCISPVIATGFPGNHSAMQVWEGIISYYKIYRKFLTFFYIQWLNVKCEAKTEGFVAGNFFFTYGPLLGFSSSLNYVCIKFYKTVMVLAKIVARQCIHFVQATFWRQKMKYSSCKLGIFFLL